MNRTIFIRTDENSFDVFVAKVSEEVKILAGSMKSQREAFKIFHMPEMQLWELRLLLKMDNVDISGFIKEYEKIVVVMGGIGTKLNLSYYELTRSFWIWNGFWSKKRKMYKSLVWIFCSGNDRAG